MQNIVARRCKVLGSIWRYCREELQGVEKKLQSGIGQDMARHCGAQNALTTGGLLHFKFS